MKKKIIYLLFMLVLLLVGCTNYNNENATIYDIIYLEEDSSFLFNTLDNTVFFAVEIWLENNTDSKIDFSLKIIFEDPILSRELGEEVILGEEANITPLIFAIGAGEKSLYGGSFKIDKSHLSDEEIKDLTNDVKIVLIGNDGYERIIKD